MERWIVENEIAILDIERKILRHLILKASQRLTCKRDRLARVSKVDAIRVVL